MLLSHAVACFGRKRMLFFDGPGPPIDFARTEGRERIRVCRSSRRKTILFHYLFFLFIYLVINRFFPFLLLLLLFSIIIYLLFTFLMFKLSLSHLVNFRFFLLCFLLFILFIKYSLIFLVYVDFFFIFLPHNILITKDNN